MHYKDKYIFIVTTLDTKKDEAHFVKELIQQAGLNTLLVDLSTNNQLSTIKADINAQTVANYHPQGASAVFCGDRGRAITAMATAFERFLLTRTDIAGILGLGGSGGTALITPAMQALPIGLPKIMVSTMASGDVGRYVGTSDVTMMYSVTDLAGLNRISRQVLANAANQMAGAVLFQSQEERNNNKTIGLTMFGVTTSCVQSIVAKLSADIDSIIFHATGNGGPSMEKLVNDGLINGVIDITTTEVCDLLFGGVLACHPNRFDVIAKTQVPFVGSCGALDMINFGHPDTIPAQYTDRLFYRHNPQVTLMRTTAKENQMLGYWIGEKLNACPGKVCFLIPEKGFSALDAPGQPFYDPDADLAFIQALESTIKQTRHRRVVKYPYHINDPQFAEVVLLHFLELFK